MKKTTSHGFIWAVFLSVTLTGTAANAPGLAGDMLAYYDSQLFTINFTELPSGGEDANLQNNSSINNIYTSDATLSGGAMFIPVLDAIQGDGFNPLWEEVEITFKHGVEPHQFFSDNEVLAAAAAGKITLTDTGELYRCSVVGSK